MYTVHREEQQTHDNRKLTEYIHERFVAISCCNHLNIRKQQQEKKKIIFPLIVPIFSFFA